MSRTILIIEDEKLLGKAIKTALEEAGYVVHWAQNVDEAWGALELGPVRMIYLDILLPVVDGYEILKRLKKSDSPYRQIPVVILSNLGQMSEIERASELGADDYVVKANIELSELVKLTDKRLKA